MTAQMFTRNTKAQPFTGRIAEHPHGWEAWRCTRYGWVNMRSARPPDAPPFTSLVFVYGGRRWERVFGRYCTPQGAARLSTKFVDEVVDEVVSQPV